MSHGSSTSEHVDPRWANLRNRSWTCASCGDEHAGLFDLTCPKPELWPGGEEILPNSAAASSTHCLTEDFCILNGEHYFVRCVLNLPLIGAPGQHFSFGVWSTLSKPNFDLYLETFDGGNQDGSGPWFGWFSNRLTGYPDTLHLKCRVHPQGGRQRPWIELMRVDHSLVHEALHGITYERLLEIYAANGHVMVEKPGMA